MHEHINLTQPMALKLEKLKHRQTTIIIQYPKKRIYEVDIQQYLFMKLTFNYGKLSRCLFVCLHYS